MSSGAAITGCSVITPLGMNAELTFEALCAGESAIGPVRGFDASGFACHAASQLNGLSAESLGIAPRNARTMGFHSHALIAVAREAHAAARLGNATIPRESIAFFTGMGMVDYQVQDLLPAMLRSYLADGSFDYQSFYARDFQQIHPLWPLRMLNNMAMAQAAIDLDLRGDNATFSPHGEAGAQAIREAERSVVEGSAQVALAAGVSENISPQSLARHQRLGNLSPSSKLRPFGAERDGTVFGEAAAALVLEDRRSASARGLKPMGQVDGYGMRCANSQSDDGIAQAAAGAMRDALREAHVPPAQVAVIFANGDGRRASDAGEARAIAEVFGPDTPVTATKAALGNTLAASAPTDAALAVLALRRGVAPHCPGGPSEQSAGINLINGSAVPLKEGSALVNVQGLGGQCAAIVLSTVREL